jgi:hypothetical protein
VSLRTPKEAAHKSGPHLMPGEALCPSGPIMLSLGKFNGKICGIDSYVTAND